MHSAAAQAEEQWYFWTDDNVRHYAVEIGSGPPIVVLHGGWGSEHSYLMDVVRPFADRYRFILYDQRGSLRSPAPDSTISLPQLVADLEHLRQSLGQDRLTLLAHSMGAQLAFAYLRAHPERVRGMVLLGGVLPHDAPTDSAVIKQAQTDFVAFAQANERRQVEAEGLAGRDWSAMTDREKTARSRISFGSGNLFDITRWREMQGGFVFYNPTMYQALTANTPPPAWRGIWDALQRHPRPLRLIIGDHDLVDFGVRSWPALIEALPDARLTVIERAGHNAWIDRPEAVREALGRALGEVG